MPSNIPSPNPKAELRSIINSNPVCEFFDKKRRVPTDAAHAGRNPMVSSRSRDLDDPVIAGRNPMVSSRSRDLDDPVIAGRTGTVACRDLSPAPVVQPLQRRLPPCALAPSESAGKPGRTKLRTAARAAFAKHPARRVRPEWQRSPASLGRDKRCGSRNLCRDMRNSHTALKY